MSASAVAPCAHEVVWTDGPGRLLRFGPPRPRPAAPRPAVLLVGSLLHRASVFDLVPHASLAAALVDADLDVFGLDWGPYERDRYFTLADALARLHRARRATLRLAGARHAALVGYSQGGTLAAIAAASAGPELSALVNLAGPIDFARGGVMARLTDPRACDADAIADAGGFFAWASDTVALPAETLRSWIKDYYQGNALIAGRAQDAGRPVDLGRITAPVLVVVAERDEVCPAASSLALHDHVKSAVRDTLRVPGGHLSGVAGPGARAALHLPLAAWLARHAGAPTTAGAARPHLPEPRP